jgi:hypothetical protein
VALVVPPSSEEVGVVAFILAAMILCCLESPAGAQPVRVDASQLCAVKDAIRWREVAWSTAECRRVAEALNETRDPLRMAAVCINESDLRERVVSFARPGVYDVGLCGVRCVLHPGGSATARGDGPRSAVSSADLPAGRCSNGPARGYTLRQLLDGPTNVRVADEILHVKHGGNLRRYNGGTREHGYAGRVGAVPAALGGVDVFAKRRHKKGPRREPYVSELPRRIVGALGGGPPGVVAPVLDGEGRSRGAGPGVGRGESGGAGENDDEDEDGAASVDDLRW